MMARTGNRIGHHWPETVTTTVGIICGIAVIWGTATAGPPGPPRTSLDLLPAWQAWAVGGLMVCGSAAWLPKIKNGTYKGLSFGLRVGQGTKFGAQFTYSSQEAAIALKARFTTIES